MRVLLQRVQEAAVRVDGEELGRIGPGLLLLVGVSDADNDQELDWLVDKCAKLRIFEDEEGRMNRSVVDIGGEALVISQFTLYANCKKGNRPSFIEAGAPKHAEPMVERFRARLETRIGRPVPTGRFGADMKVSLINDGPVTIWLQSPAEQKLNALPPPA